MASYRILLAFPKSKQELAEEIRLKLEEKLFEEDPSPQSPVAVEWARNETDALCRASETSYSLVICSLYLPIDSKAPLREEEQRGLSLVVSLKRAKPRIPIILVVTTRDDRIYNLINQYTDCRSILEGQELENSLLGLSKILISQYPISKPTCRVDIDINLDLKTDMSIGNYVIEIKNLNHFQTGQIFLDSRAMKRILENSKKLEEQISINSVSTEDWKNDFQNLGENLTKEFTDRNPKFLLRLKNAAMKVDGFGNMRIRFVLNEESYSIIFEALMDEEQELMMLQTPMYRRLNFDSHSSPPPLFMEDLGRKAPINCVIIEADTKGFVGGLKKGDIVLDKLPNLNKETAWLEEYLKSKTTGNIKIISRKTIPKGRTFLTYLSDVLLNQRWDLVHFTGHSLCDTDNTGYLILPGAKGLEKLDISKFAHFLRMAEARFVYLDSCESSAAAMVFRLVEQQISEVMGFRWPIQPDMANLYAKKFYQHLFEKRSLEEAFFHARKEVHNEYSDPQSSAALLLILQTS